MVVGKKLRIYIAGPYQARKYSSIHEVPQVVQRNVDNAIFIANRLIELGHFVFCPHLSHYLQTHWSAFKDYGEWWYEEDNTFLTNWANALFYIDGDSDGAYAELQLANKLGLKIFYSLDDVMKL